MKELWRLPCIHRGNEENNNSVSAIQESLLLNPYMIEFDVNFVDGVFKTGHPPEIIEGDNGDLVLALQEFDTHEGMTFPKIDLKLKPDQDYQTAITSLLASTEVNNNIPFYLINLGVQNLDAETFLAEQIRDRYTDRVMMNIDLERYEDKDIPAHIESIEDCVFSVSPEIQRSDWDEVANIAERYNLEVHFWLTSPNNGVPETMLEEALNWGDEHGLVVYFDINANYIL